MPCLGSWDPVRVETLLWHLPGALGASPREKPGTFLSGGRLYARSNTQVEEGREAGREVSPQQGTEAARQMPRQTSAQ